MPCTLPMVALLAYIHPGMKPECDGLYLGHSETGPVLAYKDGDEIIVLSTVDSVERK